MFFNSLLAAYAFDSAETVILWLTVAVVAALLIAGVAIFFAKREIFAKYAKYGALSFTAYALIAGIVMCILQLVKRMNGQYLDDKYVNHDVIAYVLVPLLVLFGVLLASGIALFVIAKLKPAIFKIMAYVLGGLSAAALVAAIVTISIYYSAHISADGYYSEYINETGLYVSMAVLIVAAAAAAILLGLKDKTGFDSHCIALAGITIAMSFVLSYVKLWEMPQGGSITFVSLLPIMIFAYVYGTKKGVIIGVIYGIMQAMQDCYIIHPAQFLLDYPIAFAMIGFAGSFKLVKALDKLPQVQFALGAVLAGVLRFIAHLLSGVFAFGANAAYEGQMNFWAFSAAYNSFVFIDIALVIVAGVIIFSSKSFVKAITAYASKKTATAQAAAAVEETAQTKEAE
ncbi:MAG: energy-coupled thiamine transporter ThiT [Candidatus Coproplasma sp.]